MLPAPVFRVTAEMQARRRLGLTATLVREDGREEDVFGLIGPKKVDMPWKELERQGWIATADCVEIRVPLPDEERLLRRLGRAREVSHRGGESSEDRGDARAAGTPPGRPDSDHRPVPRAAQRPGAAAQRAAAHRAHEQ